MSNPNKAQLTEDYREAVRLYVWYSDSPFSFQSGKADPIKAKRYRDVAHKTLAKLAELNAKNEG